MRILFTLIMVLGFLMGQAQNRNVIVTKATATWCPNCGTWAWDYKDALLAEFPSGPMTFLAAHFRNSDLENEASLWFTSNINAAGQPTFYINNDWNTVGSGSWSGQLANVRQEILDKAAGEPTMSFNGVSIDGDNVNCTISTSYPAQDGTEYTIAVYVYEDNVDYFQSGRPNAIHPNILRGSLGEPQGVAYDPATASYNFQDVVDPTWIKDELGLLAVLYRIDGNNYIIEESTSVANFASKTSTEELLDANIFSYRDGDTELIIGADDKEYELTLTDMSGQQVVDTQFRNEVRIQKTMTPSGMYIATFRTENGFFSQQIFIK